MSRPLEDCERCPALAGVRNLRLDDPSADRPDSPCNSGDRRIRACRSAAAPDNSLSGAVRAELFGTHAVMTTPAGLVEAVLLRMETLI